MSQLYKCDRCKQTVSVEDIKGSRNWIKVIYGVECAEPEFDIYDFGKRSVTIHLCENCYKSFAHDFLAVHNMEDVI